MEAIQVVFEELKKKGKSLSVFMVLQSYCLSVPVVFNTLVFCDFSGFR